MTVNRSSVFGELVQSSTQYAAYGFGFIKIPPRNTQKAASAHSIALANFSKCLNEYARSHETRTLNNFEAASNQLHTFVRSRENKKLSLAFHVLARAYEQIHLHANTVDKKPLKEKISNFYRNALQLAPLEYSTIDLYCNFTRFLKNHR